ncbi:hypothetical protein BDN72DRAFT_847800 [Pluteus cervinus]|uniref:Uncharacterized protein n=1 Tax=Pluteus cervinus TaxID=181527 RepID=A0ACD3AC31_9AGAR|nr:hypothetical protein BDN72DRAFT_847800 [Pluteus cervinus]
MAEQAPEPTPEVASLVGPFSTQTLLVASLSLAVLVITLVTLLGRRKASSKGTALLLVGAPDAGKTSILSALYSGRRLQTHTSLQPSSSLVSLLDSKKTWKVIDIPGHPRVRDHYREHLEEAKVVAFVVDTSTISRNGSAVAEHLHLILHSLTSVPPSQKPPSLLIIAHKTDLMRTPASATSASTVSITRVKTILERELDRRRVAQLGGVGVEGLGEEEGASEMGGLECSGDSGGAFRFAEWEGGEVAFVGSYISLGPNAAASDDEKKVDEDADGLVELREWLEENL